MLPIDHVVSKCISIDFVSWLYKTDKVTKNIHGKNTYITSDGTDIFKDLESFFEQYIH